MLGLVTLALACGTITVTLCKAKVTKRLREVLSRVNFIRDMLSCLYCTSHWVAGGLVLAAPPLGDGLVSWFVATAAVIAVAMPVMWVINRSLGTMVWE